MAIDSTVRCHSLLFGPVRGIAVFYYCNFKFSIIDVILICFNITAHCKTTAQFVNVIPS